LSQKKRPRGAFVLWKWGDREINDPKTIRTQLIEIYSKGFSGVLATLGASRYEFIDRKVIRAVAQASQWSKKRNIQFWFQADPRQASRTFITKTGERTENLIVARKPEDGLNPQTLNIAKVVKNNFELQYGIPRVRYSDRFREVALQFEPCELERVFLFQTENGVILRDSIQDITTASRFFTNIAEGYAQVFGEVQTPPGEEWYCMAFPKFSTNLYDFAGRVSNDMLLVFVENLFDACTYLDGITWGEGEVGYVVDTGRFPVSLSIYNSFLAEYQYDLRDYLYGLILPVNDESHIIIRNDYYKLLLDTVFNAQRDFYQMIHGFFEDLDVGIHHTWHLGKHQINDLVRGSIDPWQNIEQARSTFIDMGNVGKTGIKINSFISTLIIVKSLGLHSKAQSAYLNLLEPNEEQADLPYWTDLMMLYSVQWLAHFDINGELNTPSMKTKKRDPSEVNFHCYDTINRRIDSIKKITRFKFPEAGIALIFPIETIMSIAPSDAEAILLSINNLIARLTFAGIQLDVISSMLLKKGKISSEGIRINRRTYNIVIYPYPEVLSPETLEILTVLYKFRIPALLGGMAPRITTRGKRIAQSFPIAFDPNDKNLTPLLHNGVQPPFTTPNNGLGTLIVKENERLLLFMPNKPGKTMYGEVHYEEFSFSISECSTLAIFRLEKNGCAKQVL